MKKSFLTMAFLLIICLTAHAETLTLSTYYPAPFGSYDRLRLVPRNAAPLCDVSLEGLLYYNDINNTLNICQDDGTWGFLQGIWTQDGLNNVYLTNTATNPNLKIGLGTTIPETLLHISAASPALYLKGSSGADYSATIRLAGENEDTWRGGYMQYDAVNDRLILGVHDAANKLVTDDAEVMLIDRSTGNIGIKRIPTTYALDVHGTIRASGADLAENMFIEGTVEPGDVVVIAEKDSFKLKKSDQPYDQKVAGVISTDPGFCLGLNKGENYHPVALTGQVPCKVTTENGPIKKGDLLTTSSKPGYAMKAKFIPLENIKSLPELTKALEENRKRQLTIIGKAFEELAEGDGTIVILMAR